MFGAIDMTENNTISPSLPSMQTINSQEMILRADKISVCRKGQLILDSVSFQVHPGTLTAIIGPNGAGKTTLIKALTGERPYDGSVFINDQDIYTDPEYWLRQIGYVPVDHILHDQLSMEEALIWIGQLRLPNWTRSQIQARVDALLSQFGFGEDDERRHKQMRYLSTGERKRANICSELIIDPQILMLDEPTSNLDPDAEYLVMQLLADYSHTTGKIVLVVTHTLNTINICDEVIFIAQSKLLAQGSPEMVLDQLERRNGVTTPDASWFERWAKIFKDYPTRAKKDKCKTLIRKEVTSVTRRQLPVILWRKQLYYLLLRYTRIRFGDRGSMIGTLLAGFSGIMFFVLQDRAFVKPFEAAEVARGLTETRQSIYLVALTVAVIGIVTSYTEISKEFRIYRHERLKGLSSSAYLLSKWIWLTLVVGMLAPIVLFFFIVIVYQQPLPGFHEPSLNQTLNSWERLTTIQFPGMVKAPISWLIILTLVLTSIASVTIGLLISVLTGESSKGNLYLTFSCVFILLFSGLTQNKKIANLIDLLSVASPGKWAYEGISSNIGLYCWTDSWRFDEFNSEGHILSIWLSIMSLTLIAALITVFMLRLHDPWQRPIQLLRSLFIRDGRRIALVLAVVGVLLSYSIFLRQFSKGYHSFNYYSDPTYGGTGAFIYPSVNRIENPDALQHWVGTLSQSQCGF